MRASTFLNKLKKAKATGAETSLTGDHKYIHVRFDGAYGCPHFVMVHNDDIASHTPPEALAWCIAHMDKLIPILEKAAESEQSK